MESISRARSLILYRLESGVSLPAERHLGDDIEKATPLEDSSGVVKVCPEPVEGLLHN